jgi:hypothetical protein
MKSLDPIQPAPLPDAAALRALVGARTSPLVSLYVPLSRSVSEARANAAAWEGAVAEAERGLEEAGLPAAEAQNIRKQLGAVETDLRRLERPAAGLAAFHDRVQAHAFGLIHEPARRVVVAENLALRPLLEAVQRDRRHLVLALSVNRVAVYAGDARGVEPVAAPGLPDSLEDALGSELTAKGLTASATQAGPGTAQFYSHDSGRDERKIDLDRFHAKVARALESAFEGRGEPIVLVSTQAHHSGLRAALRTPLLLPEGVQASPDHLSPSELHARSWPLIERALEAEEAKLAGEFERAFNRGKGLNRIGDVAVAAAGGRVRRLWVGRDERVPGAVDLASGVLVGGRPQEDVLDGIVTLVLRHGGDVIVARSVPSGAPVAAELR